MAFHDGNDSMSVGATVRCGGVTGLNAPMPSRDELLARNSFGSPDDNPYLTTAAQRAETAARRQAEAAKRNVQAERDAKIQKKWGVK